MIDTRVLPEDYFDFMSVSESTGVELYKIICALNRRTKLGQLVWQKVVVTEENHDLVLPCEHKAVPEVYICNVRNQRIIFQCGVESETLTFMNANNTGGLSFDFLRYVNLFYSTTKKIGRQYDDGELVKFYERLFLLGERFMDTIRNAAERERFCNMREFRMSLEGSEAHVRESGAKNRDDLDWITSQ